MKNEAVNLGALFSFFLLTLTLPLLSNSGWGQVRMHQSCSESVCNFTGSKLVRSGDLVVRASDCGPRMIGSTPRRASLIFVPTVPFVNFSRLPHSKD